MSRSRPARPMPERFDFGSQVGADEPASGRIVSPSARRNIVGWSPACGPSRRSASSAASQSAASRSWRWTSPSRSPPAFRVCAASPCRVPVASCCSPPRTHCTSCADASKASRQQHVVSRWPTSLQVIAGRPPSGSSKPTPQASPTPDPAPRQSQQDRRQRPDFPVPVPGLSTTCGNGNWEVHAAGSYLARWRATGQIAIHNILWFGPAEHSPVPAARSRRRRAQRRSRPARFRAAEGLVLTAASTMARVRGTGTADRHHPR